ncbi:methyltransferase family protein [Murinocardiopsis flavida]|uniref:Methyltransferase family protein n=1 Tax=Murinocardiopsis flavida TaxID=645275 RepID=A0A2P8DTJ8_9ACTN|nr:methyltransferase [Murinocardiopsis flavida]PSL00540.1 methyltransferase family protein [Murinocardiopsis flavida]
MSANNENEAAEPPPHPAGLMQIAFGFWASKALLSAVELGVFAALAERPMTAAELRLRVGVHPRGAEDFFDALVALDLLRRTDAPDGRRYANTAATDRFLNPARPETSIGGLFDMANSAWYPRWGSLTEALRTGAPQTAGEDGADPFDELYADSDRLRRFQDAMTGLSLGGILDMAEKFPWGRYRTVADIGCSAGTMLSRVLQRHAHLSGVGFDLPELAPIFKETAVEFGMVGRMRFSPGDFFADPLPGADVLAFGHVLHDWDLDTKRMLLGKAFEALPEGGAVVVYESMIDDERRYNASGLLSSLHMLLETPGGFDYTGADCLGWLDEAGFGSLRVESLAGPDSMAIGVK